MPMEKTFDAKAAEARITAEWLAKGCFRAGANARPGAEPYSVMIPPPNVTGSLHMGHAFNNTLQDILVRWHRMRGFDTLWQPGTDHAGIATQMVVERELAKEGRRRTDMSRDDFTALVWEQKRRSRGNIIGQLQRLGASCDWDREAFTMSGAPGAPEGEGGNFHDAVIRVFVDLYNKGIIYRGKRLVNWDPHFETAISDLEVEPVEVAGHMWHFKYPLAGGATYEHVERDAEGREVLREVRDYIGIATTRPETMLGDGAVAVHPSDERYAPIVGMLCEIPVGPKGSRRLIPIITDEYPDPAFGSGAVKITGAHDFNDYAVAQRNGIPCYRLMDTKARMRDDGAPYAEAAAQAQAAARGWLIRKGYVQPGFAEQPVTPDEAQVDALNLVPDELRGLDRYEARRRVVDAITAEGLAVMVPASDPRLGRASAASAPPASGAQDGMPTDSYEEGGTPPEALLVPLVEPKAIQQPHGDRSKVVIEPMLTDQWFVDTARIVQPAIDAVRDGRTRILPEQHEKVYFNWLENIEPWCISRQLWWGHRVPVWYGPKVESPQGFAEIGPRIAFCAPNEDAAKDLALSHYGRYVARPVIRFTEFKEPPAPTVEDLQIGRPARTANHATLSDDGLEIELYRDPDVLDTWFSSGLWPIGTLGWPEDTAELRRYFPTSTLVTGFDIIFFWVARMMMMQLEVTGQVPFRDVYVHALVRDEKGKKMSKSLGNVLDPIDLIDEYGADAVRFTLTAMAAMGRDLKLSTARIAGYRNFGTKLWNACRFAEMNGVWEGHATQSAPPPATATANRWIVAETAKTLRAVDEALARYRFDEAANALYAFVWGRVCDWYVEFAKPLFDGPEAAETRAVMAWVLDQCMILLHPMMPFITEELWATTGRRGTMLVHTDWPAYADLGDAAAEAEMGWTVALIEEIRSARAQMHVPVGLKLDMLALAMDDAARAAWDRNAPLIRRLARIESLTDAPAAPRGALTVAVEGATFAIPLAGIIDIAEERARLEKTIAKLGKDMAGLRGRLGNPAFVASAPEAVVDEARTLLEQKADEAGKLEAALARLAEMA